MAQTYTQSDFLVTLAYLMGERSVNATTSAPRIDFIQETLREAYQAYPWRFARTNATLIVSNGIATLPTDYDDSHISRAKFNNGVSTKLDSVDPDDEPDLSNGDRAVWIEAIDDDVYVLKTKDSDVSTVALRYQKKAPVLNSTGTIDTPYPNKMTIAYGARRYVKLGQNPDADISQDEALFDKKLQADIAGHQTPAPRRRRKTAHGQTNSYTGEF